MAEYKIIEAGGIIFRILVAFMLSALASTDVNKLEVYCYNESYDNEKITLIGDNLNITDKNKTVVIKIPYSDLLEDAAHVFIEGYDSKGSGENVSGNALPQIDDSMLTKIKHGG
jgi:hypothetical protein